MTTIAEDIAKVIRVCGMSYLDSYKLIYSLTKNVRDGTTTYEDESILLTFRDGSSIKFPSGE